MVAVFAVAMMAGSTWAEEEGPSCDLSILDLAACNEAFTPSPGYDPDLLADGPIVVGKEWLQTFGAVSLPLGDRRAFPCDGEGTLHSMIIYQPSQNIIAGTCILLEATNGGFPNCQNLNFSFTVL